MFVWMMMMTGGIKIKKISIHPFKKCYYYYITIHIHLKFVLLFLFVFFLSFLIFPLSSLYFFLIGEKYFLLFLHLFCLNFFFF